MLSLLLINLSALVRGKRRFESLHDFQASDVKRKSESITGLHVWLEFSMRAQSSFLLFILLLAVGKKKNLKSALLVWSENWNVAQKKKEEEEKTLKSFQAILLL